MKKLIIYLSIIIILFGGLYALNVVANGSTDNPYGIREGKLSPPTRAQFDNPNYQNIILPDELESSIKKGYDGFVFYFSPTCSHCVATVPVLVPLVEELGYDMPMFNLLEFDEGWSKYKIQFTPTLVAYKDGKEVDRMEGAIEVNAGDGGWTKEQFTQFFTTYSSD